jgi:hypothetical protein
MNLIVSQWQSFGGGLMGNEEENEELIMQKIKQTKVFY